MHNAVTGQHSPRYTSSAAKDKFVTVIYVVNKADQGMFSCLSASGTAELFYIAKSPPTATPKHAWPNTPKHPKKCMASSHELHLRKGSEAKGRPMPGDARTWARASPLSWGRYIQDKVTSFTVSPALADFGRLCCVKFGVSYPLNLECMLWEVGWHLLRC